MISKQKRSQTKKVNTRPVAAFSTGETATVDPNIRLATGMVIIRINLGGTLNLGEWALEQE